MELIKLNIVGLSYSQFKEGAYALFLEEDNGLRKLSIVIGGCESQAIAIGLDKNIVSPRPLTHDLFISIAEKCDLIIEKIIIHKLEKGIFFSSINFIHTKNNTNFTIDSRTSDAIAIAIRFNAPIYTYKSVLEKAKNYLSKPSEKHEDIDAEHDEKKNIIEKNVITKEILEKQLANAIQNENYELAAKIRDQIKNLHD